MNHRHPYFPASTDLHKGLSDVVSLKPITNPIGNLKDAYRSIKGGGVTGALDSLAIVGGVGKGMLPGAVNEKAKPMLGMRTFAQKDADRKAQTLINEREVAEKEGLAKRKAAKANNLINMG